ncbi:hypothetical protein SDRG_13950 [Saprolegnia diclina VS20]|uniref:Uncharacterized protein n=1 Tax=Saprolegnia diclina (strain VS20) TaxID=1156394 RepID=T0PRY9_SAPDV|nr:hypothetical protein SDRG_13950 [Saprolegnia diclina VS20]EQC28269.1 hypothetical protein SDRG_13950 [Saprolegnia diclina VS20]|eukprot:XP_008618273.1 hypothetical protein SDRG_13950 [Saprolegnia diclina VS20]
MRQARYAVVSPKTPPLSVVGAKVIAFASYLTGIAVLCLVGLDTISNNWAINNFVGNGYQFLTPLATASGTADLLRQYSFAKGASLTDMSKVAQWMFNYTMTQLVTPDNDKVFLLSAGTFETSATLDQCGFWKGVYAAPSLTVQLGGATDSISYLRGQAFSHTFTDDMTKNLGNTSMGRSQLSALGYTPARLQADVRLTVPVTLVNASRPQSMPVIFYRYFPRSYCTGCSPSATFGRGHCNLTFVYNASSASVRVTSGVFIDQTPYHLGLMLPQSVFTAASNYLKCIALLCAIGGYLASRRTVQWLEAAPGTIWDSIVRTIAPRCFPHPSYALRFDRFSYNNDLFVGLFALAVLLDINHAITFIRDVNVFNATSPQLGMTIQLFALSTRLLWLNCATLKLLKLAWHVISTATYSGESRVMGFLNLRNVTSLYLSAILLFYVPPFIEYNNAVRVGLKNTVEPLDGTIIDLLDSWYVRGTWAISGGLLLNILLVLAFDQVINRRFWRRMANNSLARQATFNSTSILMDFVSDVDVNSAVLACKARRLLMLQWYFLSHLQTFGLPEKDLLRAKKLAQQRRVSVQPTTTTSSNVDTAGEMLCTVAQDSGHHIHLLDDQFTDITSLVLNIKVLKDTSVTIH